MITSFISKIVMAIMALVILVVSAVAVMFYWKATSAEDKVVTLQDAVINLTAEVTRKELENHSQEIAIDQLQKTAKNLAIKLQNRSDIDRDIDNAPIDEDGSLAPILRNALDGIDRMLRDNPPHQGGGR